MLGLIKKDLKSLKPEKIIKRIFISQKLKQLHKKNNFQCYSTYAFSMISPEGNVYPCMYINNSLGNLKRAGFNLLLLLNKQSINKNLESRRGPKCADCWTPCHGYINIIQNPFKSIITWF